MKARSAWKSFKMRRHSWLAGDFHNLIRSEASKSSRKRFSVMLIPRLLPATDEEEEFEEEGREGEVMDWERKRQRARNITDTFQTNSRLA